MFADFFTTLHFTQPFPSPGQAQQGVALTTPHHIDEAGYGDGEPKVQRLRHTTKKTASSSIMIQTYWSGIVFVISLVFTDRLIH